MSVIRDAFQPAAGSEAAPSTSAATFEDYDKPKVPMPAILEEIILSSPYQQMDVQELYIELRARYPYFRVHSEPSVWQNRVRNCLSTSSQFQKVAKPCAKRASFWRVVARDDADRPLRKRKRLGSHDADGSHYGDGDDDESPTVMSVADLLAGRGMLPVPVALPPDEPRAMTDDSQQLPADVDSPSQSSTIVSAAEPTPSTHPSAAHDDHRPTSHPPPAKPDRAAPVPMRMPLPLPLPMILPATRPPPLHVPTAIRGLASSFQRDVDNACREDNSMDALRDAYRRFRAEMDALLLGTGTGER